MSRFVDTSVTDRLVLPGGCQCPGTPHAEDEWIYRSEPAGSDLSRARVEATTRDGRVDLVLAQDVLVAALSISWNLVDKGGNPVPLTRLAISQLDVDTRNAMVMAVDKLASPFPKGSPVRSRNGSSANGSRLPTTTTV